MRIGFDIDDVIANLMPAWLDSYNADHKTTWTTDDLTQWAFQNDLGCTYEDLLKHLLPSLYDVVQPCEGALETVEAIRAMGHDIAFISSSMDYPTWEAKFNWLIKFGFLDKENTRDLALPVGSWCGFATKREVGVAHEIPIFVDDHIANCEGWPGTAYLLTRPHNQRHIYMGKRLKKLTDLILEVKYWPKSQIADSNGLKEVVDAAEFAGPLLNATSEGWVGGNAIGFSSITPGTMLGAGGKLYQEGEKPSNPKDLIGSDKMPFHLFPMVALIHGTLAFLEGALKYGQSNFDEVGVRASIYVDAAIRHLLAYKAGQDRAEDSGLKHLGHAIACAAILLNAEAQGNLVDDRDYKGEAYLKEMEKEQSEVPRLREKYKDRLPKHYTLQDRKND